MGGWKRLYSSLDMFPIIWSIAIVGTLESLCPSTLLCNIIHMSESTQWNIWGATLRKTAPINRATRRKFTKYQTSLTGTNTNPFWAANELWTKSTLKGTLLSVALQIVKLCLKMYSNISSCHWDEWKWLSVIASLMNVFTMRVVALDCFVKKKKKKSNYYAWLHRRACV